MKKVEADILRSFFTGSGPYKELFEDAIQKRIPRKPSPACEAISATRTFICPSCGGAFTLNAPNACWHCGQLLDWSDGDAGAN